jgi:hypothetical protein
MATYSGESPWANTTMNQGGYLNILQKRTVIAEDDDILYEIQPQYTYRPDLLSFDLYGTAKLWWVFAARNVDVIKDPYFDFVPGTFIYLPKKSSLSATLGI